MPIPPSDSFGARLAAARVRRGWSQTDLGKAAGMAPTQVSRYEAGRATPRGYTLGRLAYALAVRVEWLVTGETPMESGGGPAKESERTKSIEMEFDDQELAELELAAAAAGTTVAGFMRRVLEEALEAATSLESEKAPPSVENIQKEIDAQRARLEEMAKLLDEMADAARKQRQPNP